MFILGTTEDFPKLKQISIVTILGSVSELLYDFGGGTPGEYFLKPMLDHLLVKSQEKKKSVVLFLSDGKFNLGKKRDPEAAFNDKCASLSSQFPQFFPIFISFGNSACLYTLMATMSRFSFGRLSFQNETTTTLCDVLSEFHDQVLVPRCVASPLLSESATMVIADFPVWPNSLTDEREYKIICGLLRGLTLLNDNKLNQVLSDILKYACLGANRNALINLVQKISTIDIENSETIVDHMQSVIEFEDAVLPIHTDSLDIPIHTDSLDIFPWHTTTGDQEFKFRIIGYKDEKCTMPISSVFINSEKIAFISPNAKIFYTIELLAADIYDPVVLTIRDKFKNIRQYVLERGQGIIDGGSDSRFAFEVNRSEFETAAAMSTQYLEFQFDFLSELSIKEQSDSDDFEDCVDGPCMSVIVPAQPVFVQAVSTFQLGNRQLEICDLYEHFMVFAVYISPTGDDLGFITSVIDTTGTFAQDKCVICMFNTPAYIMTPCKHLIICDAKECRDPFLTGRYIRCPMCNQMGKLILGDTVSTTSLLPVNYKKFKIIKRE